MSAGGAVPGAGRVLGLDLGERRIGVACSDGRRLLATPQVVLERGGDPAADRARLAALVAELEVVLVVVGLPLSLDGRNGPAARAVLDEVEALRGVLPVPVSTFDERLSTLEAARRRRLADEPLPRRSAGTGAARRPAGASRRARAPVDAAAAAVVLQGWLDAQRGGATREAGTAEQPGASQHRRGARSP
ncbi:MAG TPA: Holliday junction resolvase RuvX [Acidimicrobiales bacterium]|nr:Holliday junction resolvase RuvX [Acidimicrobiales bacterium]